MRRTKRKSPEGEIIDLDNNQKEEIKEVIPREHKGKGVYLSNIIVNLLLLYFFNNLLRWDIDFVTADFAKVLPFVNWSIQVTILFSFIYLFYEPKWFKKFTQIILNILAIIFLQKIYLVFPLTLSSGFTLLFRFCLRVSIFVIIIITLINLIQFLLAYSEKETAKI